MNRKTLFGLILLGVAYLTYYALPHEYLWEAIDRHFFHFLNRLLSFGKGIQIAVAIGNHKLHDWLVDALFISLLIRYIFEKTDKARLTKALECALVLMVMGFVIFVINRNILYYWEPVQAISPSRKYSSYLYLNDLVPFLKTKMHAKGSSFPGDHATTAFLFYFLIRPLFSIHVRRFTLLYVILISLPRLIVGAHNLSDILIGSSSVVFLATLAVHSGHRLEKLAFWVGEKISQKNLSQKIDPSL